MIMLNGQEYAASNVDGTWGWIVKWFKKELKDQPEGDQFVEASVSSPHDKVWTEAQAVAVAVERDSWA
jgi:hypothetical protein